MKEFIDGFADETRTDRREATENWAAWSRQLSDRERTRLEARGYEQGVIEGEIYKGAEGGR